MTPQGSDGLTQAEAQRRLAARGSHDGDRSSRSTASILRANLLTPFNAILFALGVLTLAFADWRDALFLAIIAANSGIGIWQELKAKRALDELAALVAPHAVVVRDGVATDVDVEDVVVGDLVLVGTGDQLVADGSLVRADGLQLDESILTGESRAIVRAAGEAVRSGSFVVEGSGALLVTAAGPDSYAERIAGTAREFRHPRSPLELEIGRLLYVLVGVGFPLGIMLVVALAKQDVSIQHAVETAVAGIVTLIPEGLILLISVTFAAAAIRLTRLGAFIQQLNAIESLASVDTICLDKTGTLTQSRMRVVALEPMPGVAENELAVALGRFASAAPDRNATTEALHDAFAAAEEEPLQAVPFSSARRWSGLRLRDACFVLGAPDLFQLDGIDPRIRAHQQQGRRAVALGVATAPLPTEPAAAPPPSRPLGVVILAEALRDDAADTVAFLAAEGVDIKILSGDDPATVLSIAKDVGLAADGVALDGRELPEDDDDFRDAAWEAGVVGRIDPDGKRRVVEMLARHGRYVAMVGDGVNDVPALKAARLAIAPASGTEMARAVADVVLVPGDFAAVPRMVAEGRRILRNIQRVAKLFVTKSVFAAFLILAIGLTPTEYPLLPRHLTVVAALTVGTPAFFLALAPSEGPWRPERFLTEIGRFAVPAGVAAGLGVIVSYLVTLNVFDLGLVQARTAATSTLVIVGLYLVLALEATGPRRARWVGSLCVGLFSVYVLVLALSGLRSFFELAVPHAGSLLMIALGAALSIGFLWLTDDRFVPRLRGTAGTTDRGTMET